MGNLAKIIGFLPLIIQSITTATELLAKWKDVAAKGDAITDAELAQFAADMEDALAESQAALRG